jgi:DNA ligase (NAD+)
VIHGLGVRHVGDRTANLVAERFGSMRGLLDATTEEIADIPGIGDIVATGIHDFTVEQVNRDLVAKLEAVGVRSQDDSSPETRQRPLAGLTLVLTGRLDKLTRPEAEATLRRLGANVTGSVSKKTSAVIAGADAGSKAAKAGQLGVPLLDEADLATLLAGQLPTALASPVDEASDAAIVKEPVA